ncbi:hypothetical protein C8F01DRAFT_1373527 [Mycena amicta]|nr:hypothetical protein C8F01DRAFT_1373527 [Mycena amicta]
MSKETAKLIPWHTTYSGSPQPGPSASLPAPVVLPVHYHTIVIQGQPPHRRRRSCCRFLLSFLVIWLLVHAVAHHVRKHHWHECKNAQCRSDSDWLSANLGIIDVELPKGMFLKQCLHDGEILAIPRSSGDSQPIPSQDIPGLHDDHTLGFSLPIATNTSITFTYQSSHSHFTGMQLAKWWSWVVSWIRFSSLDSVASATNVAARPILKVATSVNLTDTAEVAVSSAGGTTVCHMEGRDGQEIGIHIFVRLLPFTNLSTESTLYHQQPSSSSSAPQVTLSLPEANPPNNGRRNRKRPTTIRALTAYLPNFVIDLTGDIALQTLLLTTTNAPVNLQARSLKAERVTVQTTNGAVTAGNVTAPNLSLTTTNAGIRGSFNASQSLSLRTTNAPINVIIGLESSKDAAKDTTAHVSTTNAYLDASVSLSSTGSSGGRFSLTGSTTNRPLFVDVSSAPKTHKLTLNAHTTNARAEAHLPLEFQGAFMVQSSQAKGAVVSRAYADKDKDPRIVSAAEDSRGRYIRGAVYENDEGKTRGRVNVQTSNAKAVLVI